MDTVAIGVEDIDPRKVQGMLVAALIIFAGAAFCAYLAHRFADDAAAAADSVVELGNSAVFDARRAQQAREDAEQIATNMANALEAQLAAAPATTTEEPHA